MSINMEHNFNNASKGINMQLDTSRIQILDEFITISLKNTRQEPSTTNNNTSDHQSDHKTIIEQFLQNTGHQEQSGDQAPSSPADDIQELVHDMLLGNSQFEGSFGYYLLLVLYIVVICVGVSGNVTVIIAVLWKKSMQTPHNLFIAALAVSGNIKYKLCFTYDAANYTYQQYIYA